MFKIPYEEIVGKIAEKTGKPKDVIENMIKEKQSSLSGLITRDGAAQIIASELNVNVYEEYKGPIKIEKIVPGMRNVETAGKVVQIYPIREFTTKDGREGKVASIVIGDETGTIRLVLWNDITSLLDKINEGDIIKIENAMSKQNNNRTELQIFKHEDVIINPTDITIDNVAKKNARRVRIEEINESMENIEIFGNIVSVFEPRFFEVCPQCGKRVKDENGIFRCNIHGEVEPKYSAVMNIVVDDGSSSIRTALFANQINAMLKQMDMGDIMGYKDNPMEFQKVKDALLGEFVKVIGKSIKSEAFDRVEFRAQLIFLNPDPEEEIKRLSSS